MCATTDTAYSGVFFCVSFYVLNNNNLSAFVLFVDHFPALKICHKFPILRFLFWEFFLMLRLKDNETKKKQKCFVYLVWFLLFFFDRRE